MKTDTKFVPYTVSQVGVGLKFYQHVGAQAVTWVIWAYWNPNSQKYNSKLLYISLPSPPPQAPHTTSSHATTKAEVSS
jgi:hypothetical protein